jgi:hypothetical protein
MGLDSGQDYAGNSVHLLEEAHMGGFIGLIIVVVVSFVIGGPLGFIVLGSLIGLGIKTALRR